MCDWLFGVSKHWSSFHQIPTLNVMRKYIPAFLSATPVTFYWYPCVCSRSGLPDYFVHGWLLTWSWRKGALPLELSICNNGRETPYDHPKRLPTLKPCNTRRDWVTEKAITFFKDFYMKVDVRWSAVLHVAQVRSNKTIRDCILSRFRLACYMIDASADVPGGCTHICNGTFTLHVLVLAT